MRVMKCANPTLNDSARRCAEYDELGYLFYSSILKTEAVERVREGMVRVLVEEGLGIRRGERVIWKGTDIDGGRAGTVGAYLQQRYRDLGLWQDLVNDEDVRSAFAQVAGEDVVFLPNAEYRMRTPGNSLIFWHQDGYVQQGIGFRTAWIPLVDVDESLGGLAIAERLHKSGYLHDRPMSPIDETKIPLDSQVRANCEPGDIVVFGDSTPHTGLPNLAEDGRIRLSVDVRFLGRSEPYPVIGAIGEVTRDSLTILSDAAGPVSLKILPETVLMTVDGTRLLGEDIGEWDTPIGTPVIASRRLDSAFFVRPLRYIVSPASGSSSSVSAQASK